MGKARNAARTIPRRSPRDEATGALLLGLIVPLGGAAGFFFLLYVLLKPTVHTNPGLAAYEPPPQTRLLPLPRKSDAPELAELPPVPEPPSPLTAYAQAPATEQKEAKREEARPPVRKRPREYDQRMFGYSQQWNDGYRGWNNYDGYRGWNNSRAWGGGSRSWF